MPKKKKRITKFQPQSAKAYKPTNRIKRLRQKEQYKVCGCCLLFELIKANFKRIRMPADLLSLLCCRPAKVLGFSANGIDFEKEGNVKGFRHRQLKWGFP